MVQKLTYFSSSAKYRIKSSVKTTANTINDRLNIASWHHRFHLFLYFPPNISMLLYYGLTAHWLCNCFFGS